MAKDFGDNFQSTGYLHPSYADSLSEFGAPICLSKCGGWIIKRQIPNTTYYDGMGCYPLFACQNWSKLHLDFEDIKEDLVCVSLVADPFGKYSEEYLKQCFPDIVLHFKEHFIVDLKLPYDSYVVNHHRRYIKKAMKNLEFEVCQDPIQFNNDLIELYDNLILRHDIRGLLTFSRLALTKQLNVPGIVMFRAIYDQKTVGLLLWYTQGDVAYYHLGASSSVGYQQYASFGLFSSAIEYFRNNGLQWLDLGGGSGLSDHRVNGLSKFKQGWSTGTRTAYFCGIIFDREKYSEVLKIKEIIQTNYFPAYRKGEFS